MCIHICMYIYIYIYIIVYCINYSRLYYSIACYVIVHHLYSGMFIPIY